MTLRTSDDCDEKRAKSGGSRPDKKKLKNANTIITSAGNGKSAKKITTQPTGWEITA